MQDTTKVQTESVARNRFLRNITRYSLLNHPDDSRLATGESARTCGRGAQIEVYKYLSSQSAVS